MFIQYLGAKRTKGSAFQTVSSLYKVKKKFNDTL